MDAQDEKITLPELPVLKKVFECEHCGKKYKTKKSYEKHVVQCSQPVDYEQLDLENMDLENFDMENIDIEALMQKSQGNKQVDFSSKNKELEKLRNELEQLLLANPMMDISNPVNVAPLEAIKHMTAEELKARIFQAKRELNGKLDMKISDSALNVVNLVIGRMLGCVDELQEEVMKDIVLRESAKDLLSMSVLSKVPPQLKVSGLYAVNVGVALQKKKASNSKENAV